MIDLDIPLRPIVLVVLVVLLAWLVWRALRVPAWQRRRTAWIAPGLALAVLLPTAVMEVRWQLHEREASDIVREVSGNPDGYVHCQRMAEAMFDATAYSGFVWQAKPDKAIVKLRECQRFMAWRDRLLTSENGSPDIQDLTALGVIIHEGMHVGGEWSEAQAQCQAQKAMAGVLVSRFRFPQDQADALARIYTDDAQSRLPSEYRGGVC